MIKGYSSDALTAETGVASSDIKHLTRSAHPKNMLTILIRPYKASDVSSLVSLFRASVRGIAARDYDLSQIRAWAPDTIDELKFGHRRESKATWVAEVEDRIGGFSDLASDGHVDSLYVHPDFQRRGVHELYFSTLNSRPSPSMCIACTPKPASPRGPPSKRQGSESSSRKPFLCGAKP